MAILTDYLNPNFTSLSYANKCCQQPRLYCTEG